MKVRNNLACLLIGITSIIAILLPCCPSHPLEAAPSEDSQPHNLKHHEHRNPGKMNIVTTTPDLDSIAEAIAGEMGNVKSIATGYQDPHFVEAKPSYMMMAKKADLWIRIGLELEIGYEQLIIDGSRNRNIRFGTPGHLDVSEGVLLLEVPTTQKVDRSMGDIHPYGNPHIWLDPYNVRIMAKNVHRRLMMLSPENSEYFDKNLSEFLRKLDEATFGPEIVAILGGERAWLMHLSGELDFFIEEHNRKIEMEGNTPAEAGKIRLGGWMGKMNPYRGWKIVTYHRSWSYLANRFGIIVADELEPKPGIPPSPGHVLEVINKMKAEGIKIILMEPYYSLRAPDLVSEKTEAKVVMVANSVGGEEKAQDYLSLMDNIIEKLVHAFESQP
ncbi:MAG: metal ABC transporter substrate-binding protein [Acidobacteriota bacterium]